MKMSPLLRAIDRYPSVVPVLVHTGQHYDENLSDVFFRELGMKAPDIHLDVGSGKHGEQTARVIERFEAVLLDGAPAASRFDGVVVVGDVNSTMACALAAVKLHVPVAHVEAGLRSFDRAMPEEINRIVTDAVCETLFVSEPAGVENLRREGHPDSQIHLVGNVMIDTLRWLLPKARQSEALRRHGLSLGGYGVVTLHRPSNVDQPETLAPLLDVLIEAARELPLVFPVHPRTARRIEDFGLGPRMAASQLRLLPPLGYLDFLAITSSARLIVTDSGGLQAESTVLGIPCLTARENTESPITVAEGTNTLVGNDPARLRTALQAILQGTYKQGHCPDLWDGHAAERIAEVLCG
jgi:UDP-N-acetylglucosamine 2-epimerase (non-hydrolysing)